MSLPGVPASQPLPPSPVAVDRLKNPLGPAERHQRLRNLEYIPCSWTNAPRREETLEGQESSLVQEPCIGQTARLAQTYAHTASAFDSLQLFCFESLVIVRKCSELRTKLCARNSPKGKWGLAQFRSYWPRGSVGPELHRPCILLAVFFSFSEIDPTGKM